MAKIAFRLTYNRLPEIARKFPQATKQLVEDALADAEMNIKDEMAAAKSGRWYDGHQASAPGEAPAIDSGELVESLEVTDVIDGEGAIGTNAEHAEYLEYGTSKMAARPFMTPAGDVAQGRFLRRARELERLL